MWEGVSSQFRETEKMQRRHHESDMRPCSYKYLVVALGCVHNKQVWNCLGSIYLFKFGFHQVRTISLQTWWNCTELVSRKEKVTDIICKKQPRRKQAGWHSLTWEKWNLDVEQMKTSCLWTLIHLLYGLCPVSPPPTSSLSAWLIQTALNYRAGPISGTPGELTMK